MLLSSVTLLLSTNLSTKEAVFTTYAYGFSGLNN